MLKKFDNDFTESYVKNNYANLLKQSSEYETEVVVTVLKLINQFNINIDDCKNVISDLLVKNDVDLKLAIIDAIKNNGSADTYLNTLRLLLLEENSNIKLAAADAIKQFKNNAEDTGVYNNFQDNNRIKSED
jgi:hypothetical protein